MLELKGDGHRTCHDLQRVISQDPVPQQEELIGGEVAGIRSHHPLKGNAQSTEDQYTERRGVIFGVLDSSQIGFDTL